MIEAVLRATVKPRHILVKIIAPKLFYDAFINEGIIRPMFSQLDPTKPLIGVEIGVHRGANAERILKQLNIKKLYLIDPYIRYQNMMRDRSKDKATANKRLKSFSSTVEWIYERSNKASEHVPNNLDFVYIDGNHDEKHVQEDIQLYYPKIKKGGLLGGHDFAGKFPGVVKAVIKFVKATGFEVDVDAHDWWIKVGESQC